MKLVIELKTSNDFILINSQIHKLPQTDISFHLLNL